MNLTLTDRKSQTFLAILILVLCAAAVYFNMLKAPFIFDDHYYVVERTSIRTFQNFSDNLLFPSSYHASHRMPYRPLSYFTLMLNFSSGRLNPFGYHLFNLIIHIINTFLVFFLAREILNHLFEETSASPFRPALIVALIFACHPINTEVVSYISPRSESLSALFYFLSLLLFIRSFQKKIFYALSLLSFALALLSKETAVTLPAIILLADFIILSRLQFRSMMEKKFYHLPYWILLIGFAGIQFFYFGQAGVRINETFVRWSPTSYLAAQFYVILRYLGLLLIPIGQCLDHYILPSKTFFDPKIIFSFAALILIFALLFVKTKKSVPLRRLFLFCASWLVITLSPTSSFLPIFDAMAERRLYLPELGFFLFLIGALFLWMHDSQKQDSAMRWKILAGSIILYLFVLAALTLYRNQKYNDPILLWQEAVERYPMNDRAFNNMGQIYVDQKQYDAAMNAFQKALELHPDNALAFYNMGGIFFDRKDYTTALKCYQKAIEINPASAQAHYNLGKLYSEVHKEDQAMLYYQKAIQLDPNLVMANNNLAILYSQRKEWPKVLELYEKAIKLDPYQAGTYYNLGNTCFEMGDFQRAIQSYAKAIEIDPSHASSYNNIGNVFFQFRQYEKALPFYEKAIELNPQLAEANYNAGIVCVRLKQYKKAVSFYETALKLAPEDQAIQAKIIDARKAEMADSKAEKK